MIYRIEQGLRALFAWTRSLDDAPAREILSPRLMALFKRMRRSEQLHSLRVLATLRSQGHDNPDVLVAALLHDVGKSRFPIGLVGRTVAVLVKAFAPRLYRRWASGEPRGWRRAFVVVEQHAAWGAEMLEKADASPAATKLVRRHQERLASVVTDEDVLLAALQAADAAN